jgi:hypothetical protein
VYKRQLHERHGEGEDVFSDGGEGEPGPAIAGMECAGDDGIEDVMIEAIWEDDIGPASSFQPRRDQ